jgi:hypothetical protein
MAGRSVVVSMARRDQHNRVRCGAVRWCSTPFSTQESTSSRRRRRRRGVCGLDRSAVRARVARAPACAARAGIGW